MRPLALRLERSGYRVHNLGYSSTRSDPRALVDWLSGEVAARCAGARRVHFVGHSLGGILARALLARQRPAGLGRVVLLAPPNRGSEWVDWLGDWPLFEALLGPTARALGTGPESLPNQIPAPDYELGVIAGTGSLNPVGDALLEGDHDGTVRVENARLSGMRDFLTLPVSHTFIMRSPQVARHVLRFLREGRFDGGD